MDSVTIRVPATTANLGPGYDCLGVALQIYNEVTVRKGGPRVESEMVSAVERAFFHAADVKRFDFAWQISGEVPRSRGLGSSVTVRLGLLHGLNELCDQPLAPDELFAICAELEGHPDNAAPAAFGGFTVAGGDRLARFEVAPELRFVLLVPDFEVATPDARRVLPAQIDRLEAVKSCANACRITAAFAEQRYALLRGAFSDGLHQPFRSALVPDLFRVIEAGEAAGALGGFLSGSGSTIACLVEGDAQPVADAMLGAATSPGVRLHVTSADNEGTVTVRGD